MDCPFCSIEENSKRVLERGDKVITILSDPKPIPGHVLVLPKRHVEKLSELSTEELRELMHTTARFQEKIISTLSTGCDVRQHFRPFQKDNRIVHLHIHLEPRDMYTELLKKCEEFQQDVFRKLNPEEKERISDDSVSVSKEVL